MSASLELVVRVVLIGTGATLVMDLWGILLRRAGIATLDFALLGRWIGHLPDGQVMHASVAKATQVRGEVWIGWGTHYAIGIAFSGILVGTRGLDWARAPTVGPALAVGMVTVIAPLFILQPAMGAGIASTKTARPLFNTLRSIMTHLVFGVGLYLAAYAASLLVPVSAQAWHGSVWP